jgi:hypothetical protein
MVLKKIFRPKDAKIEKNEMGWAISADGEERCVYRDLVGET